MSSKLPFRFGEVVHELGFINRDEERKHLKQLFSQSLNVTLLSPRRIGKSSLIRKATGEWVEESDQNKIIYIDLYQYQTEREFYDDYLNQVTRALKSKTDEVMQMLRDFFKHVRPAVQMDQHGNTEFTITSKGPLEEPDKREILDLPFKIAEKKNVKLVVCLDEFQVCDRFNDSVGFQRLLRSVWQHHTSVSYCLSGSKMHMMEAFFSDKSLPFYRFGELIYLENIDVRYWIPYILEAFDSTEKEISEKMVIEMADRLQGHPHYMQHLSWILWMDNDQVSELSQIDDGFKRLIAQNSLLFEREVDHLTNHQLNVLRAVANGEKSLSSAEVLNRYSIPTSAHVYSALQKLVTWDLVRVPEKKTEEKYRLTDPLMANWIRNTFPVKK